MATEASLTDQAAHKQVEEMKVDDDIKDVNEDIVFQPKVLERKKKEEEGLKAEDPTIVEASVTEQKEISDDSIDTLVEDVKNEEENKESAGGASDKEPNSEAAEQKENLGDLSDALVEGVKVEEENKVEATEKEPESEAVEQKKSPVDSSDVVEDVKKEEENREPEGVPTEKEPESEAVEQKESSDDSSDAVAEDVKKEEKNKEPEGVATKKEPESEAVEQKESSDDSSDAVAEDVKKEEKNKEPEGVATEKEPESEAVEQKESSDDSSDAVVEDVKKEEKNKELEAVATEKKPDSEAAVVEDVKEEENKEPEGVTTEKELDSEAAVETTENSTVSLIQESTAESAKDTEVSDAEMKTSDDLPSALEIEDTEVETPGITALEEQGLAVLEAAEATIAEKISPEAVASLEPLKEETSSDEISDVVAAAADSSNATSVDTDQVNEKKDIGAIVTGAHIPTSDDSSTEDSTKEPVKEESASGEAEALKILTGGQDKEEKVALEEEPIVSDASNAETATEIAEKSEKSESLDETSKDVEAPFVAEVASEGVKDATEDDKTILVETSRDLNMDSPVKEAESEPNAAEATETIIDKSVNKDSEQKKDENEGEKTEVAKDDDQTKTVGEGQEAEVPVKSSQRQSNSIMSKVKHSIVKVKKAIIGKSSSSKNMSPEGKDDTKAK